MSSQRIIEICSSCKGSGETIEHIRTDYHKGEHEVNIKVIHQGE